VVIGQEHDGVVFQLSESQPGNTYGNYSGKLSHNGERVALSMPQSLYTPIRFTWWRTRSLTARAGAGANGLRGGGSSLELIDPHSNHRLAANWADSDESQKSAWTDVENTGVLDNGANYESSIQHAQIGILDVGECLVDNVEADFAGEQLRRQFHV
jgi:hypothetical protein